MLLKINYLFKRHEDFAIETTLATRSLKKMVKYAQAEGYEVTVLYFWLNSPDLAVERVKARVAAGGHNIPEPNMNFIRSILLPYFPYITRLIPIVIANIHGPAISPSVLVKPSADSAYADAH